MESVGSNPISNSDNVVNVNVNSLPTSSHDYTLIALPTAKNAR